MVNVPTLAENSVLTCDVSVRGKDIWCVRFYAAHLVVGETGVGCNTFYTLPNFSKPIQSMQITNIPCKSISFDLISIIVSLLWHRYK